MQNSLVLGRTRTRKCVSNIQYVPGTYHTCLSGCHINKPLVHKPKAYAQSYCTRYKYALPDI